MKKIYYLILLLLLMGGFLLYWLHKTPKIHNDLSDKRPIKAAPQPITTPTPVSAQQIKDYWATRMAQTMHLTYPRWDGGRSTSLNDPRWKILNKRDDTDPWWRGKIPIEFYGRVIDDYSNAVAGASASFSWVDLSPAGTSQRVVQSDAQGNFSITGIKGVSMLVNVSKDGYLVANSKNHNAFDFASFSSENFYQPDAAHPVIFHLRKKGITEPLVHNAYKIIVSLGKTAVVKLNNGQTTINFTLLSNDWHREGKWELQVSLQNGGIIPTAEEFITQAPAEGYQLSFTLDKKTPKSPKWPSGQGGFFYLQSGQNYGRIDIRMIPGLKTVYLDVWINPKPGSRNIELPNQ
jgi:hypothetical protein